MLYELNELFPIKHVIEFSISYKKHLMLILLLCAVIYSESYWQTLWISRKISRNKCFSHIHFVFNQNVFKFVLKFNWTGRSSPHNYDTSFPHFFFTYIPFIIRMEIPGHSSGLHWSTLNVYYIKVPDLKFADVILWCCLLNSSENYYLNIEDWLI